MKLLASTCMTFLALLAGNLHALTVSGTVNDGGATPLQGARVIIYNENPFPLPDTQIDDVFANAAGFYTTPNAVNGHDVYVVAKWEFSITASPNNSVIQLLDVCGGQNPCVVSTTFTDARMPAAGSIPDIVANVTLNVTMGQSQPANFPNLITRINHTTNFMNAAAPPVPWSANYDMPLHVITDQAARAGNDLFIPTISFGAGATTFWIVTIYHEVAHKIHRTHNGGAMPNTGPNCGTHTRNSEETRECALVEGWASYVGQLVAEANLVNSPFYTAYRDPGNNIWRGDEAAATGRDGTVWENGEKIEGTTAGAWFGLHGNAAFNFPDNLKVMIDDQPDHFYDFFKGFVSDAGGSGAANTLTAYGIIQTHGIFFTRARLKTGLATLFDEDDPPDDAASIETGNVKEIGSSVFLRGSVTVNFEDVPKADLGVVDKISLDEIRLGWAPAADSTSGGPAAFSDFTPFANFGLFNDDVTLDTRAMDGATGDGDWDLLAVGKNSDGFVDNLLPTWVGDGNATVNQDELYLKVLGAWYDKDRDPSTNTPDEGKVIVDNSAPTVDAASFKPQ